VADSPPHPPCASSCDQGQRNPPFFPNNVHPKHGDASLDSHSPHPPSIEYPGSFPLSLCEGKDISLPCFSPVMLRWKDISSFIILRLCWLVYISTHNPFFFLPHMLGNRQDSVPFLPPLALTPHRAWVCSILAFFRFFSLPTVFLCDPSLFMSLPFDIGAAKGVFVFSPVFG